MYRNFMRRKSKRSNDSKEAKEIKAKMNKCLIRLYEPSLIEIKEDYTGRDYDDIIEKIMENIGSMGVCAK